MTSRVIRGGEGKCPGALAAIIVSCDNMECETSIDDKKIAKGGGLKEMGWSTVPINGTVRHYCPKHH